MALFVIGDTHLSLSCDKPMDIFKGWADYVERIETNWNKIVGENDSVVIPGDISWAMSLQEAVKDFEFLNNLNGTKYILKGNHDYWWNTASKMNKFFEENNFDSIKIIHNNAFSVEGFALAGSRGWFYDDTADADKKVILREAGRLRASLKEAERLGGEIIAFLHYPPLSETQKCDEILDVLGEFSVKRCFFGHLHGFVSPANAQIDYNGTKFSLVSADYLKFVPRLITSDM
ncbi:MAG: serine/threonine protein phosphatase [Ruminococcaceae bacterium]|nr:serine/threonine protein phosphatase [Oscillospiraceae bacterium]